LPRRGARFIRRCAVWATLWMRARGTALLRRARHRFNAQAHSGSGTQVAPRQAEMVYETETLAGIAAT
jgi:hypothetical protein